MTSAGVPEVSFVVNYSGITVSSRRLTTPRFVPFDKVRGRCDECKSNLLEIDYAVQSEGVTIITSRMKQAKFVKFDSVEPLPPNMCLFRVKFQGKTFDVNTAPGWGVGQFVGNAPAGEGTMEIAEDAEATQMAPPPLVNSTVPAAEYDVGTQI